jgi:hypothetical protein
MKKYEIEYRDCTGMRCGVEIEALYEKEAIIKLQQELITHDDYMTELLSVDEKCFIDNEYCKCDDCNPDDPVEWKLDDGTVLDQDSQSALNDAMLNMVNKDGMTLKQVWDKEIEESKNK